MKNNDCVSCEAILSKTTYFEHDNLLAVCVRDINDTPDVSHEIITRFLRAYQNICKHIQCCPKCPLYGLLCGKYDSSLSEIEEAIAIVERFLQEHPEERGEDSNVN